VPNSGAWPEDGLVHFEFAGSPVEAVLRFAAEHLLEHSRPPVMPEPLTCSIDLAFGDGCGFGSLFNRRCFLQDRQSPPLGIRGRTGVANVTRARRDAT
jgi:hypothetical protein